ncbi:hypothetical protein TIFTF001_020067 [Ficus carica]|uniref:sphingosine kinase n=1 Tax=Ficus carica TaxID=3494 RepID=A0AA88AHJ6_FICCA|nr:hypothetical protein TIFTF001_020067 [Ficus carica]
MDQTEPEPSQGLVFSDRVTVNGDYTPLTLSDDGVIRWPEGAQRCLNVEKEVLGFATDGLKIKIRTLVESGDGIACFGSRGALVRKTFAFHFSSQDSQSLFCLKLRECIDSLGRPKRLFVLVNPFGGQKLASKILLDQVKPLLNDADIQFTLQETQYQLHAKEVAKTMDLSKYDGIVCVSGDGILVEVVNGLLEREDWETAIKTPLGVVPAGTGNGMAKSLLDFVGEPCTASNSVLAIIRGHKRSLDVSTILQGETKFFSVLMLAWGLIADIDIESEKYRWMGSARLDFYALLRVLCLRKYNGRVSFVPAPGFEAYGKPRNDKSEATDKQNISGSSGVKPVKFSDGYIDLIITRDCPKLPLLSLMTEMNNGNHVNSPYVMYLKVKAFILEPGPQAENPTKEGIIDSDGEVLARGKGTYKCDQKTLMAYDKIQLTVDQGLATLFSPL